MLDDPIVSTVCFASVFREIFMVAKICQGKDNQLFQHVCVEQTPETSCIVNAPKKYVVLSLIIVKQKQRIHNTNCITCALLALPITLIAYLVPS